MRDMILTFVILVFVTMQLGWTVTEVARVLVIIVRIEYRKEERKTETHRFKPRSFTVPEINGVMLQLSRISQYPSS
jgi:cytochrome bd-type quinol oxidase subunit 1